MTAEVSETRDLKACHAIRHRVFVVEQGISLADEVDGRDGDARHLLATINGVPLGTARILIQGNTGKIGRVAVLAEHRGKGYGKALIQKAVEILSAESHLEYAKLGAQTSAIGFYEALGFQPFGDEYLDAGLPHRDMVIDL